MGEHSDEWKQRGKFNLITVDRKAENDSFTLIVCSAALLDPRSNSHRESITADLGYNFICRAGRSIVGSAGWIDHFVINVRKLRISLLVDRSI